MLLTLPKADAMASSMIINGVLLAARSAGVGTGQEVDNNQRLITHLTIESFYQVCLTME